MNKKNTNSLIVLMTFLGYNITVSGMMSPPEFLAKELAQAGFSATSKLTSKADNDTKRSDTKDAQPKPIPDMTIRHDLCSALQSGDLAWVYDIAKKFDISTVTSGDDAWIDRTWQNSHSALLEAKAIGPVELGTRSMLWMSLHFAIHTPDKRKQDRLKIVELFLNIPGSDVNEQNYFYLPKQRGVFCFKEFVLIKGSLLHMATIYDRPDLMKLILTAKKCALNETTSENLTALHYALLNDSPEAVQLLVEAGADINIFKIGCCRKIPAEKISKNPMIRKIILDKKNKA